MNPERVIEETIIKFVMGSDSSFTSSDEDSSSDSSAGAKQVNRNRIDTCLAETVASYSEEEFYNHFRMSPSTAQYVTDRLKNSGFLPSQPDGRPKIGAKKAFLMTLCYLANQETFRQVADRFHTSLSSVYRTVERVTRYLVSVSNEHIQWPDDQKVRTIVDGFKKRKIIDNVIAAIDCCHIEIKAPTKETEIYVNNKGYHSVILQGTVDSQYQFIDVYCGEPGSLNDATVLRNSPLYARAEDDEDIFHNKYIVADSDYPLLPWLRPLHEDSGTLTEDEESLKNSHSVTRIVVENTFSLLKERFCRLQKFDNNNIKFIVQCIVSACVLHNICIGKGDILKHQ